MGGPASKATESDLRAAWEAGEPFKAAAARLGMSPNTLRARWQALYGVEAFTERGKRIQAAAASDFLKNRTEPVTYREVVVPCSACGTLTTVKAIRAAHFDHATFRCETCSGDRNCPVCNLRVDGARGLSGHFRHRREAGDEAHIAYEHDLDAARWAGRTEDVDFVVCRLCEYKGVSVASHLVLHDVTAATYRQMFPGVRTTASALEEHRIEANVATRSVTGTGKGDTKEVACPKCGAKHSVSKFVSSSIHDLRCSACVAKAEDALWVGKVEGDDFVRCRECGHRAENLTSHVQNAHPELVGRYHVVHGASPMVAWRSAVRDKSALRGRTLSDETRAKMAENAGRWNAGLTKATDERVAAASAKMEGRPSWSKGLTKEEHPSLASNSDKQKGREHPWAAQLAVNLTGSDLAPFLDEQGRVDVLMAVEMLDVSWPVVRRCVRELGLEVTDQHVLRRNEASIPRLQRLAAEKVIHLEKEEIVPYRLKNGKVLIAAAVRGLGVSFHVVARECDRHGFETFRRNIRQTYFLDAVSKVLGGAPYEQEWRSYAFLNSRTGHRYKYDGFFPDFNLLAESDGYLHYTFPNNRMPDESYRSVWEELLRRDAEKTRLVADSGRYKLLRVRQDEPYTDPLYIAGRLVELGVLATEDVVVPEGRGPAFDLFGEGGEG